MFLVAISAPAMAFARELVDPSTLIPPVSAAFNPVCYEVGQGTICDIALSDAPVVHGYREGTSETGADLGTTATCARRIRLAGEPNALEEPQEQGAVGSVRAAIPERTLEREARGRALVDRDGDQDEDAAMRCQQPSRFAAQLDRLVGVRLLGTPVLGGGRVECMRDVLGQRQLGRSGDRPRDDARGDELVDVGALVTG